MAKERTVFVCQSCGAQASRWLGRCTECGEWNTLVEERVAAAPKGGGRAAGERRAAEPITSLATATERRSSCGIGELDRVLGGGVVPGSVILIGGDPGIGKSTLVLQALGQLARQGRALYVTGEESHQQVKMRADRLGITEDTLLVLAETNVEAILEQARAVEPAILAIDSIQTMFTEQFASAPVLTPSAGEQDQQDRVAPESLGRSVGKGQQIGLNRFHQVRYADRELQTGHP